jgi:nitrilase
VTAASSTVVAAVVQEPPVFLDRDATVAVAVERIAEAASNGARLVAFAESFVPGYPGWIFGAAGWDDAAAKRLHRRLAENSLEQGGPALTRLCQAAADHHVTIVMGASERDTRFSRGTLYNTLFTIADTGELVGVHRKLMPTHAERMVWGAGDASGLVAHDLSIGRVGGLICWEHWMPLSRFALHAAGEQIHVAAWPETPEMHQIASRHYAFEGRCFVLLAGGLLRTGDLPDDDELRSTMLGGLGDLGGTSEAILPGGSAIIGPDGAYLAGPADEKPEILYAELDLNRIIEEQLALDSAGHYHRPDVFALHIRTEHRDPVVLDGIAPSLRDPVLQSDDAAGRPPAAVADTTNRR